MRPWTIAEDNFARQRAARGWPIEEIAFHVNRSPAAVVEWLKRRPLAFRPFAKWEDQLLGERWEESSPGKIARRLNRTEGEIVRRARELDL